MNEAIQPVTTKHRLGMSDEIRICDMNDEHLLNTLRRLVGNVHGALYLREAMRRGLVSERPTFAEINAAIAKVKR